MGLGKRRRGCPGQHISFLRGSFPNSLEETKHIPRELQREDYRERGMQNPAVDTQMRHYIEIILLGWNKSLNGTSREAKPDFSLSEKGEG